MRGMASIGLCIMEIPYIGSAKGLFLDLDFFSQFFLSK